MLKLLTYPNEILSCKMPDFDFENPIMDPKDFEEQLIKLMYENNGIGLAAPQVDIKTRAFAIVTRNNPEITEPFVAFNPKILAVGNDEETGEEGCLSFPNLFFHVNRPSNILVEFLDRNKNKYTITLKGIDARCFLHELDHLDGICFTDRISKFKLDRAIEKQRKRNGRTKQ